MLPLFWYFFNSGGISHKLNLDLHVDEFWFEIKKKTRIFDIYKIGKIVIFEIVFTLLRLIWNQTEFRLATNQPENRKYNLISVDLTRIKSQFLSVALKLNLNFLQAIIALYKNSYQSSDSWVFTAYFVRFSARNSKKIKSHKSSDWRFKPFRIAFP